MKKTNLRLGALALIIIIIFNLGAAAFAVEGPEGYKKYSPAEYYDKLIYISNLIKAVGYDSSMEDDPIRDGVEALVLAEPDTYPALKNHESMTGDQLKTALTAALVSEADFTRVASYILRRDRYTGYIEPDTYESNYTVPSVFVGIGVAVESAEGENRISVVYHNSPASEAGLHAGDVFIEVDGDNVTGCTLNELIEKVSGPKNSKVTIGVRRKGNADILYFTMTRREVTMDTVLAEDLGDNTFCIRILLFNGYDTILEMINHLNAAEKAGAKKLVLDLRDNPGGDTYALLNVLNCFVKNKDVLLLSLNERDKQNPYYSTGSQTFLDRIVVLVNERSASAAEAMAGALRDLKLAKIVGVKTYGKGMGQQHIRLDNLDYAIITTLRVELPVSGAYDLKGITPDYIVENKIVNHPIPELPAMSTSGTLFVGSTGAQVNALEQRLKTLGYFTGTPDESFDAVTMKAINNLRGHYGLADVRFCGAVSLTLVDLAVKELSETPVVEDTQMQRALELLKTGW